MTPLLHRMLPPSTGWLHAVRPPPARPRSDIALDQTRLYRSECFAEDLQAGCDAAAADPPPLLRGGPAADGR